MRRLFFSRFLGLPILALAGREPEKKAKMDKILVKSAWGSSDPTQASFPFYHASALADAGHPVQIFLLGEAVTLLRSTVASSIVPVGWPPLAEAMAKTLEHKIPVTSEGLARGPVGSSRATWTARTPSSPIRPSSSGSCRGRTSS